MRKIQLLILLSFAILTACTKSEVTNPPPNISQQGKTIPVVFPHTVEFFQQHGQAYLEDKTQCQKCHGADSVAANPKVNCQGCHEVFPHAPNWKEKTEHAANYMKNPQACAKCHGVDGSGGTSKVSCKTCHNYPHPKKWAVPENHGKTYEALTDKSACLTCHASNNKDGAFPPKCQGCHQAFPFQHTDENWFGDPALPGHHNTLAKQYAGKCLICHREYKDNMPNFGESGGCITCHTAKKIEIHWIDDPPKPAGASNTSKSKDEVSANPNFTRFGKRVPANFTKPSGSVRKNIPK